jgi:hypothetical protein
MSVLQTVALWGLLGGVVLGLALHFLAPPETRARLAGPFLRFGSGGVLFMLVWYAIYTERAMPAVEIAVGLTVVVPLVAGIVLAIARMLPGSRS